MSAAFSELKKIPAARRAVRQIRGWRNHVIDLMLGTRTELPRMGAERGGRFADGVSYEPIGYFELWRFMGPLAAEREDVVFDVGCGMGRVTCAFARLPVRKCVGIELDPELAEQARQNARRLRGRRAEIEVRTEDACATNFADATVLFLFNPFGAETLRCVLDRLKSALQDSQRRVRLAYCNPKHQHVLEASGWLHRYGRRTSAFSEFVATYWTNDPLYAGVANGTRSAGIPMELRSPIGPRGPVGCE